jgi:hypothetical protein
MTSSISTGIFVTKRKKEKVDQTFVSLHKADLAANLRQSVYKQNLEILDKSFSNIQISVTDILNFLHDSATKKTPVAFLSTGINVLDYCPALLELEGAVILGNECHTLSSCIESISLQLDISDFYSRSSFQKKSIVIFPDFESCDIKIIEQLLMLVGEFSLPYAFVFGIANPASIDNFTFTTLDLISYKKFSTTSSMKQMENIFRDLLRNQRSVRFSHKLLVYLYNSFVQWNFSTSVFHRALRFSLLDHFYNNPLSSLNVYSGDDSELEMNNFHLERIMQMNSFQFHCNRLKSKGQEKEVSLLLLNRDHLEFRVHQWVKKLIDFQTDFTLFCQCFIDIVQVILNDSSVSSSLLIQMPFHELYLTVLDPHFLSLNYFSQVSAALLNISTDLMLKIIEIIEDQLVEYESMLVGLKTFKNQITLGGGDDFSLDDINRKFQVLFLHLFRSGLSPSYFELPLHELFFIGHPSRVKRFLYPSPQNSLIQALKNPNLNCQCCDGKLSSSMEDVSIVFHLYEESGRNINIQDWFEGFRSIIGNDLNEDEALYVFLVYFSSRFTTATSGLKHCGFFKISNRKEGHAIKCL